MGRNPVIALAYDFDGTLAPGNMQEHSFLPDIGISSEEFWKMAERYARKHNADSVLTYMNLMLRKAQEAGASIHREDFVRYGKSIKLFPGTATWFKRVNQYGKKLNYHIEHYIISSGLREMIEGTEIAPYFKRIFASSFQYNENGVAEWPALALNFTNKTQYLFRINKGVLDVFDNKKINAPVAMKKRPVPFERIIFVGDGETDIPCFSLVKSLGGHSIAVYLPKVPKSRLRAEQLVKDNRVNYIAPADYSADSEMSTIVQSIMDKIAIDDKLDLYTD